MPPVNQNANCPGSHRYFVADVAVVQSEGTVAILAICLGCGHSTMAKHEVTKGSGEITLEKQKRINPNE